MSKLVPDRSYLQCAKCASRLFFIPLPAEVFTACGARNETVKDIDIGKGISPFVAANGMGGGICHKFTRGKSVCEPTIEKPFLIPKIRQDGEAYLMKKLAVPKRQGHLNGLVSSRHHF